MTLTVEPIQRISGTFRPPSDKSLTHRAYMFAAIARGESRVKNPLRGEDCASTLRCLNQLGLRHEWITRSEARLIPVGTWSASAGPLDCGNSGTTMRLLSGLLAARPLDVVLIGDASLSRRPMKRIAEPLRLMGAMVEGDTPPLHIKGNSSLKGIEYVSPVASAQVKSCTLLAGLSADGPTTVREPSLSRDHTERMLRAMGVDLTSVNDGTGHSVTVQPTQDLQPFEFDIPGDISSAAFLMTLAALIPNSRLEVTCLSTNPSRTGIFDVFTQAQVPFELGSERLELGEPVNDLHVQHAAALSSFVIEGDLVPRLIDEIPVLAVLATQCEGTTFIRDAKELRVKESDRIETVSRFLNAMGAKVTPTHDGMVIEGPTPLHGAHIEAHGDHRIAMSFYVAGLIAQGTTTIEGADSIETSFPGFVAEIQRLNTK